MPEPKRGRGRPRKPDDPWAWVVRNDIAYCSRVLASADEDRKRTMSDVARKMHAEDRNTANENRARKRRKSLDLLRRNESELIGNLKLSPASVASHLHKVGRGYGVAPDTLRKYIAEIRENSGTAKLIKK